MTRARCVIPLGNVAGCESRTVEKVIERVPGVADAYVNPAIDQAYIDYDPARTDPPTLARAIERAGYHCGTPREIPA
jgi:P-type Cu+ transporter